MENWLNIKSNFLEYHYIQCAILCSPHWFIIHQTNYGYLHLLYFHPGVMIVPHCSWVRVIVDYYLTTGTDICISISGICNTAPYFVELKWSSELALLCQVTDWQFCPLSDRLMQFGCPAKRKMKCWPDWTNAGQVEPGFEQYISVQ